MGLAFLITTDRLQLLGERKVLKEAEYAALLDASQVVSVAQAEARRIAEQARADAAASERRGFEKGLQRARSDHAERLAAEAMASERQLHALRESMAFIVVEAIGQFLAEVEPAARFEAALRRVDALIRQESFVMVLVPPASESALRAALDGLRETSPWAMRCVVQADPSLADGVCTVRTASGSLEIGIDAQLEAFRRAVAKAPAAVRGDVR
ncbi:MAG: type III secretion system stator protein SctL [Rhizobacter sp.]